jgi:hypothetical protein
VDWPAVVPLTVAVKLAVPPGESETLGGATLTEMAGAETETVAVADLLESAALVARTWKVPPADGAVYRPPESTVPPELPSTTDQFTPVD